MTLTKVQFAAVKIWFLSILVSKSTRLICCLFSYSELVLKRHVISLHTVVNSTVKYPETCNRCQHSIAKQSEKNENNISDGQSEFTFYRTNVRLLYIIYTNYHV